MKVSILIPVYNEERYVGAIFDELLAMPPIAGVNFEIIAVDDGSTDKTRDVLKKYEAEGVVKTLFQAKNKGKGAAIISGLTLVSGDVVLIQDADREYEISDYPQLLEPFLKNQAQVVYGSRFLGQIQGMKLANRVFNILISYMVGVLFGVRLTDEATAYKILRTDIIKDLNLKSQRFEICPEITAKVLRRGITIHEVPIHYRARTHLQGKKIKWTDAVDAVGTLLRYRFFT